MPHKFQQCWTDFKKFAFNDRVVDNSPPATVIGANSAATFERPDKFWKSLDVKFDSDASFPFY